MRFDSERNVKAFNPEAFDHGGKSQSMQELRRFEQQWRWTSVGRHLAHVGSSGFCPSTAQNKACCCIPGNPSTEK